MSFYPSRYYKSVKSSETQYSRTPQGGGPNIQRLINNQPYWRVSSTHNSQRNEHKTLIFADWTCATASTNTLLKIIDRLNQLDKDGFKLYLLQDEYLEEFPNDSFDKLLSTSSTCLEAIKIMPHDQLKQMAFEQHQLPHDNVLILDQYEFECLEAEQDVPRRLSTYSLAPFTSSEPDLIPVLRSLKPPVSEIIHDCFSEHAHTALTLLQKAFPDIPATNNYLSLCDSLSHITTDGNQIAIDGYWIVKGDLAGVQHVTIPFSATEQQITQILSEIKNIRELRISGNTVLDTIPWDRFDFSQLEVLYLEYANISPQWIQHILAQTNTLQSLSLINYTQLEEIHFDKLHLNTLVRLNLSGSFNIDNIRWKDVPLNALRILIVCSTDISGKTLCHMLNSSPKIQYLDAAEFDDAESIPEIPESFTLNPLPYLKIFDISGAPICPKAQAQLLLQAGSLQEINECVYRILIENPYIDYKKINFTHVKRINLFETLNPDNALLHHIFQQATQLEFLNISNLQLERDDYKFPRLQTLILQSVKSMAELQKAIAMAPKLYKLSIDNKEDVECLADTNWRSTHLPLLKILEIKKIDISPENFRRFQKQMPNLELLELESPGEDFIGCLLKEINFPSLQHLSCKYTDMYGVDLRVALGRLSGSLEELFLLDCVLEDEAWHSFEPMPLLRELALSHSTFPPKTLRLLIEKSPNLKVINIAGCKQFYNFDFSMYDIEIKGTTQEITAIAEDPLYNPEELFDENPDPSPESYRFTFKGTNKTLNQHMVIEKLSQYLTLTQQHTPLLYLIKQGICLALSVCFLQNHLLTQALKNLQKWDGRVETLTEQLHNDFKMLWFYVSNYQLTPNQNMRTYIGDNLLAFLNHYRQDMILVNANHAIALRFIENSWYLYDPNFVNGPKKFNATERLVAKIHQSIGTVIATSLLVDIIPEIANPEKFMTLGGLSLLPQVSNSHRIQRQLSLLPEFSTTTLKGLFTRDAGEIPAWASGLENTHTNAFMQTLLYQFIKQEPDYKERLSDSIRLLKSERQKYYFSLLVNAGYSIFEDPEIILNDLFPELRAMLPSPDIYAVEDTVKEEELTKYASMLETWQASASQAQSLHDYLAHVIHHQKSAKKHLIELTSAHDILSLQLLLLDYCLKNNYPVYCINSPDNLVCSASFIQRQGNIGVGRKGPGGPLYDFLVQHQNSPLPPVLLINFDEFKASDRINHNNLLDTLRKADGVLLPAHTLIVGLHNPFKAEAYRGSDFNSRFDLKESCPFPLPPLPEIPEYDGTHRNCEIINLGHAIDWEERLLGRWIIKKDLMVFEEGALKPAIKTGSPLQIHNAPWDNMQFLSFWHQARIKGAIPETLPCYKSSGRIFTFAQQGTQVPGFKPTARVLNPGTFDSFFKEYVCDNEQKTLDICPGFLPQNPEKTLEVNLTRELSEEAWSFIIEACNKYSIRLNSYYASAHKELPWQPELHVIRSNDPEVTMQQIMKDDMDWVMIPVTECTASSLISTIIGDFSSQTTSFSFQQIDGLLKKALDAKKKIILHGEFSQDLMDHMAPLLLSEPLEQSLVLISQSEEAFHYLPLKTFQISPQEKWYYIHKMMQMTKEEWNILRPFEQESSNQLCARLRYFRAFGSTDAWNGLTHSSVRYELNELDLEQSQEKAQEFTQRRINAVNALLQHSPIAFLSGPTAVGKSTFVLEEYAAQEHVQLFCGEENLEQWAKTESKDHDLVLFIDEANISPRQWSEFSGLFHPKPSIIINGIPYKLSPRHKVIFAGNPLSYGGERQLAPLFEQHGTALEFEPMPLEFIYEKLLKPAVLNTPFEPHLPEIAAPILEAYRFICKHSYEEILISPRELQMMLLMTLSSAQQNPQDAAQEARRYAYELAYPLVPEPQKEEFKNKCLPTLPKKEYKRDLLCPPSRWSDKQLLNDLLNLRVFRRQANHKIHQYGGLGGIVLEGEVGIGKSELVLSVLKAQGYIECTQYSGEPQLDQDKLFYHMPVSMQLDEKKELLLKAFHEGAVVIADEINSSAWMEALLNALLMGNAPGKIPPLRPGFLLIGTQNPAAAGKSVSSTALLRRLIHLTVYPYTDDEMVHILNQKSLSYTHARSLVRLYHSKKMEAQVNHLTPEPTFRDLLRVAAELVNDLNKAKPNTRNYGFFSVQNDNQFEKDNAEPPRKRMCLVSPGM